MRSDFSFYLSSLVHNPEKIDVCLAIWLFVYGLRYGIFTNVETPRDINKLMPKGEIVFTIDDN